MEERRGDQHHRSDVAIGEKRDRRVNGEGKPRDEDADNRDAPARPQSLHQRHGGGLEDLREQRDGREKADFHVAGTDVECERKQHYPAVERADRRGE